MAADIINDFNHKWPMFNMPAEAVHKKVVKPAQNLVSTTTQLQWLKFPYFCSTVGKHQSTIRKVACVCPAVWNISAELIPCQ